MDIIDALESRHTVRAFKREPIDKQVILKIMEAATHAPSWANTQPWEIFVATGKPLDRLRDKFAEYRRRGIEPHPELAPPKGWPPELQERMKTVGLKRFESLGISPEDTQARRALEEHAVRFFEAPIVVYLCVHESLGPWSIFDLGALSQSIMLAAQEYEIDSAVAVTLVAYPELIHSELEISEELQVVIGIALGRAETSHVQNKYRSERRDVGAVVRWRGF